MRVLSFWRVLIFAVGCGACGGQAVEAPATPMSSNLQALTEIQLNCPPVMLGNDEDVGKACTAGGRECEGTRSPYCTADLDEEAPYAFCIKMCFTDSACGTDASCKAHPEKPGLKGCIPNACLP
jgi:hypothetical protein